MAELRIEWDEATNRANQRKHRVSFQEAATVFYDENALLLNDPEHSTEEDRFVLLGLSSVHRIIVVCHCYRSDNDVVRIISARRATRPERRVYVQRWRP